MSVFDNIKFPFLTHQQLNLDWILQEIKRVMGFFPESGDPGTVLMKTEDGTSWEELAAVDININGVPEDTELSDTDKLIFYDVSASANRKITAPNLLNSMMSNGTPLMDGTGSAGTSKKPARYDHRHPTDTSRQAALSGVQMNAVNSGAPANSFDSNGVLKFANGGMNESGSTYCKMPDGTLICWGLLTDLSPRNLTGTATGAIYYHEYDANVTFPVAFTGIPAMSVTVDGGDECAISWVVCNSTSFTSFDAIGGAQTMASTKKLRVSWIAIGRWK